MYLSFFEMLFIHSRSFISKLRYRLDYGDIQVASTETVSTTWKMIEVEDKGNCLPDASTMRFTLNAKLMQTTTRMQRSHDVLPLSHDSIVAPYAYEIKPMIARFYALSFVKALHDTMRVQGITMDQICVMTGMTKLDVKKLFVCDPFLLTPVPKMGHMCPCMTPICWLSVWTSERAKVWSSTITDSGP